MPAVVRQGLRIHFTDSGEGPALLLLNGLGAGPRAWTPLLPHIAAGRRVISVDHRGSGASEIPGSAISIADLADDAAAVMRELGLRRAHVIGNSLGGMVAQELALRHPGMVRSLTLAATSPGVVAVPSHPSLPYHLLRAMRSRGEVRQHHLDVAFHGPATTVDAPHRLIVDPAAGHMPQGDGARRQLGAALRWSSLLRLQRIGAPTLVVHGTHDRLVPLPNARLLARLIPEARLIRLERAGHFFITDAAEEAGRAMHHFMCDVEAARVAQPARRAAVSAIRPAFGIA